MTLLGLFAGGWALDGCENCLCNDDLAIEGFASVCCFRDGMGERWRDFMS